jgi:hypothetical protein
MLWRTLMAADPEIAKAQFDYLVELVRRDGKPYQGGTYLRETAHTETLVCESCGQLPGDGTRMPGDWGPLCHDAMDHVQETGHTVVVEQTSAAIYGPKGGSHG